MRWVVSVALLSAVRSAGAAQAQALVRELATATKPVGAAMPHALFSQLIANMIKLVVSDDGSGVNATGAAGLDALTRLAHGPDDGNFSAVPAPTPADAADAADNHLWLCKRSVYPTSLLLQAGIPLDVAREVRERGYHAYILHGRTPATARAYQFTATNGWALYNSVLSQVREKARVGLAALRKHEDLEGWARQLAATIDGPAEASWAPAYSVVHGASACWQTDAPSRCTASQMDAATRAYAAERPTFNLLHNNCARFACAMLAQCGPPSDCAADACAERLMFGGRRAQPGCGTSWLLGSDGDPGKPDSHSDLQSRAERVGGDAGAMGSGAQRRSGGNGGGATGALLPSYSAALLGQPAMAQHSLAWPWGRGPRAAPQPTGVGGS